MKKWLSSLLFGARAESTPSPQPAAPVSSATDRKLDAIWSNYFRLTHDFNVWQRYVQVPPVPSPFRWQDDPGVTVDWPDMLEQDRRFIMARLPVQYGFDGRNLVWDYPKVLRYPSRCEMREAGGFAAYSLSEAYAASIRQEVEDWQREAYVWSRDEGHRYPHHEPDAISLPDIEVHLLDPEAAELVKVKIPRWPFPPPQQQPAPAKLIPQQPRPGIGKAMPLTHKKVKKLSR